MQKEATIAVSSRTGNTAYIAEGVVDAARSTGWTIVETENGKAPKTDVVVICFWCRRHSLDDASLEYLSLCEGKRILALGTFGGYPTGAYAKKVRDNVANAISERNECLGVFLCQGKLNESRIEKRRALPPDDPHHLDDFGYERALEGLKHPNETDLLYAKAFTRDFLPSC
ncbi:MAG: hypothetical protein IJ131_05280 [Eggerthellaceae bacterium]|nr:hypothetical protein [Eggerthellaceae bacterium]